MLLSEIASGLASVRPFGLLAKPELERLAPYCSSRQIRAGDHVYSEDEWVDYLWALTSGLVRISLMPHYGSQATVGVMKTGELIGCLNGICRHKHPSEALAIQDSEVVRVPKRRYLELLENKDFSRGVVHLLVERLWEAQMMLAAAAQPTEKRLAWTVLWLHGKLGRRLPLTRRLIAEISGVARETSIRALSPMEKKGWIKTRRGVVEILKPERLKELLEPR